MPSRPGERCASATVGGRAPPASRLRGTWQSTPAQSKLARVAKWPVHGAAKLVARFGGLGLRCARADWHAAHWASGCEAFRVIRDRANAAYPARTTRP